MVPDRIQQCFFNIDEQLEQAHYTVQLVLDTAELEDCGGVAKRRLQAILKSLDRTQQLLGGASEEYKLYRLRKEKMLHGNWDEF